MASSNVVAGLPKDVSGIGFCMRQLDLVQVAGTHDPLWVVEIYAPGDSTAGIVQEYQLGLRKYHKKGINLMYLS